MALVWPIRLFTLKPLLISFSVKAVEEVVASGQTFYRTGLRRVQPWCKMVEVKIVVVTCSHYLVMSNVTLIHARPQHCFHVLGFLAKSETVQTTSDASCRLVDGHWVAREDSSGKADRLLTGD